ncbi:uncharacterized protein [Nicotiana sylvestris]|uniref:uncharacterized protein n=1 Tax=Nicotiana sylvestris TaxID=4096 RepID=UPI00388C530C
MKWTTLFPYCIWEIWKNRNHNNINNLDNYLDIRKVIHAAWEFTFFTERNPFVEKTINVEISWIKPNKDVIKLNCDGTFSSKCRRARLGGAFRNNKGDWIVGYHKLCQAISPIHAELLALLEGLKIATDMNFIMMEVETDCTKVIKLTYENNSNSSDIVCECRWLMHQLKIPVLKHNFREGNMVAHLLAKQATKNVSTSKYFYHACLPRFVEHEVTKDKNRVCNGIRSMSNNVCNYLATMGNTSALKTSAMPM